MFYFQLKKKKKKKNATGIFQYFGRSGKGNQTSFFLGLIAINLHIFGLIFQKPLTCIRNNIILHVYHNLKCDENWWKAAYRTSSVLRFVSYALCECIHDVRLLNFALFYPDKLITGEIKIFVQNKIFSQLTDLTFWDVCNQNQTIILSQPNVSGLVCKTLYENCSHLIGLMKGFQPNSFWGSVQAS